ncbi:ankyrin repeat domain-containing protein 53 isoform X1 [Danio rerio]|uniref:Ankyrin repeat domain-containing protein 53 isoform X1 n=3 Tax=Danio rerio TaxID=7955 RepID=A0A0R4IMF1_DANRE|nr:ankyrin repeat domain-containing protein 53 isoform X1 [Danio rerio]|eukprot:XP_696186.2 ankyrin repeat domain-containing protein 53 isoform X1 [Danio rerio]
MSVLRKDNNEAVVGGSPPESDMFHAAASGARDWLSLTLKKARKPLITDKHGLSVLHIAALHGHLDCMELLLAGGYADVNVSCPHGRRPLHMMLTAQSQPNTHAGLIYLLEHGAHISVSTDEGLTPLHQAAAEGLTDCTETLVRHGANTHTPDTSGHTPLDLARIWGHRDTARFLKDAMWRKDKEQQMKRSKHQHNLRQELLMMTKSRGKCVSVLDLPRLGRSGKAMSSPWTEVVLHLSEELKPGHY